MKSPFSLSIDRSALNYKNIRVIKKDATLIHPAVITNNKDYNFLEYIRSRKNSELGHVVKKYKDFLPSYKEMFLTNFWDKLSNGYNREKIISFYQSNYTSLFDKIDKIDKKLILINGKLECSTANDIITLKKASDLKLCIKYYKGNKKLLCHHDEKSAIELTSEPKFKDGKRQNLIDFLIEEKLTNDIHKRLIHLFVEISNAPTTLTKLNFLSIDDQNDDEKEKSEKGKPFEIKERFDKLQIIEQETLEIEYKLADHQFYTNESYHLNSDDKSLHLSKRYNKSDLAECLSEYLFNNKSLKDTIDLIIFRKDISEFTESSDYKKIEEYVALQPDDKDSDEDIYSPANPNPQPLDTTTRDNHLRLTMIESKEKTIEEKIDDVHKNFSELTSSSIQNKPYEAKNSKSTPTQATDRKANGATNRDSINEREQRNKETGNESEQRALNDFIEEFIGTFDIENNKEFYKSGIKSVWTLINEKLNESGKTEYIKYKNQCMEVIENKSSKKEDFKKSLIPLFYFTLHYPFASFDLVVYDRKAEQAKLIEVKGSKDEIMSKFHLSDNEINEAIGEIPYEIVIVEGINKDPRSIGNPIKIIKHYLQKIETDQFELTPKGYEFIFKN